MILIKGSSRSGKTTKLLELAEKHQSETGERAYIVVKTFSHVSNLWQDMLDKGMSLPQPICRNDWIRSEKGRAMINSALFFDYYEPLALESLLTKAIVWDVHFQHIIDMDKSPNNEFKSNT